MMDFDYGSIFISIFLFTTQSEICWIIEQLEVLLYESVSTQCVQSVSSRSEISTSVLKLFLFTMYSTSIH